jgi:CheY-like chemotaxis protein
MSKTVLIVEDEADLAGLLSDVLQAAGYEVTLTTARRAADRAIELQPAAIVIDYLMPGLTGAEVMERIRAAVPGEPPPVVLVTGMRNAAELAQDVGADVFLQKPFDMDELIEAVDRLSAAAER